MLARRRILFGVVALALPVTGFAVFGTPAIFAGASAPAFPVACKITATLTFSPALTATGTHGTSASAVTTLTISSGHLPLRRAERSTWPRRHSHHGDQIPRHQTGDEVLRHGVLPGLRRVPHLQ